ncbi:MAG: hypothetical protein ACI8P3_002329 [Saprospiraceae bacterium]|jgi:hypothetical protein
MAQVIEQFLNNLLAKSSTFISYLLTNLPNEYIGGEKWRFFLQKTDTKKYLFEL